MIRDWSNFIADRTAIVTGSGGGVGRAIAIQMARAGAHVWINDLHPERAEIRQGRSRTKPAQPPANSENRRPDHQPPINWRRSR